MDSVTPRNVGEALLVRLRQLGVERFFANPGTEFTSLIRGFHELPAGLVPEPVIAPHEHLAMSMAYGAYLASGKPQAVMTHANVGAANALLGLIAAARMNVPLIYIGGMTSASERESVGRRNKLIHWSQDTRDQAAACREYVKWECEVHHPSALFDVLDRAYAIATSAPYGPVAVHVSRDVLMSELSPAPVPPVRIHAPEPPAPAEGSMRRLLRELSEAKRPLVVTNRLGADPEAVRLLADLSRRHGFGVVTPEDYYVSFPAEHEHHLGFRQSEAVRESDFVISIDTDVPWFPLESGPGAGARLVQVGTDPLFESLPLRSHGSDLTIQACPRSFLRALSRAESPPALLAERVRWVRSHRRQVAEPMGFGAEAVSKIVAEVMDDSIVLLNELGLSREHLGALPSGSYFRSGAASPLGWGVGCGLGIGMFAPGKRILACVGDGVFYLSPVLGALAIAAERGIPFLLLILNNWGMRSIADATRDAYPGLAEGRLPLTGFSRDGVNLAKCAEVVSGLGLRASSPGELRAVLREGFDFLGRRRPVVIEAVLAD